MGHYEFRYPPNFCSKSTSVILFISLVAENNFFSPGNGNSCIFVVEKKIQQTICQKNFSTSEIKDIFFNLKILQVITVKPVSLFFISSCIII